MNIQGLWKSNIVITPSHKQYSIQPILTFQSNFTPAPTYDNMDQSFLTVWSILAPSPIRNGKLAFISSILSPTIPTLSSNFVHCMNSRDQKRATLSLPFPGHQRYLCSLSKLRISQRLCTHPSKWVNDWVCEWVIECVCVCVRERERERDCE